MSRSIQTFVHHGAHFLVLAGPTPALQPPARAGQGQALTPSEEAVADAWLQGYSAEQIAIDRGVSQRTIRNQIAAVYQKLQVGSRAELALIANGLRLPGAS